MGASGVIFMIVYALAVVAEFYFVPMYLKAVWPEKSMRSLKYKMVCSALFMLAALCCMFYSNNYTSYTAFMLTGLAFGLVGDLLIHYPTPKKAITALGGVSFFIGHIFYIVAFSVTMKNYFPQAKVLDYRAVTVILALAGINDKASGSPERCRHGNAGRIAVCAFGRNHSFSSVRRPREKQTA